MPTRDIAWNVSEIALVVMYALVAVQMLFLSYGAARRYQAWKSGQPYGPVTEVKTRLSKVLQVVFLHRRILRRGYVFAGLMHLFIFYGFIVLFIGTLIVLLEADIVRPYFGVSFFHGPFYVAYKLIINFFGLLFSPGKGLVFYSPLVVLGALGLPRMWREDRSLALALLGFFVTLNAMAAVSTYWGDEVWGPRYIVPAAWALLVPIAWWATTINRQRVLVGLAVLGAAVQLIGVSVQYSRYTEHVRALTGVPIYRDRLGVDRERIPYGNDGTRWVPELSALLVQSEALISSQALERLGGDGLEVTYAPFEGRSRTLDFGDPRYTVSLDYWWIPPPDHRWLARLLALAILLASLAAAAGLYVVTFGRGPPWGTRNPAPAQ